MADRGTFTPLHPTTRKYVAHIDREPLPARLRELIERLHEAETDRNPHKEGETQRRRQGKKYAHAH